MYTFNPLAPVTADHFGFGIIVFICVIVLWYNLIERTGVFFVAFFFCTMTTGLGYWVSYHWTDQTVKYYANTQVIGDLVGFQPEGYSERSGKSRADRHYMYVVYAVNGEKVILQAREGVSYPQRAVLYKN